LINRGESSLKVMRECSALFADSFVFGTGVADPVFWAGRPQWRDNLKEWKPVLDRCRYVGVRGPRSKEILSEIGVDADIIGDPVLALSDIEREVKAEVIPHSVGFNIGQSCGNVWGSEEKIQKEFTQLAILAKNAGWTVKWLIVWPRDREITLQVAHASGTESRVFEIYNDPQAYLDSVRTLSVFVGMKLHAVVLATCAFVPSVMLEYRPKCRDYMRSIEQEAYSVSTDCFESEHVWDIMRSMNAERSHHSDTIADKIRLLRDKQTKKASELMLVFSGCR